MTEHKRLWFSGRTPRCGRGDPGSIPGGRTFVCRFLPSGLKMLRTVHAQNYVKSMFESHHINIKQSLYQRFH